MFTTSSPGVVARRISSDSYNSDPDAHFDENENENVNDNYLANADARDGARGYTRAPSPHPMALHLRPPRESFVRQSLAIPGPEDPRESFIPYSAFEHPGMPEPSSMVAPQHQRASQDLSSFVGVDEDMEIGQYQNGNMDDEEFARRGKPARRPSRLRRLARALLRPFRFVKSAIRMPTFLQRRKSRRSTTSGWDFRDPTPAPTSIRQQLSRDEADRAQENVTVVFPPSTAPPTMIDTGAGLGNNHRSLASSSSSGAVDSARGRSTSHHSHVSHRAPSHRSAHTHKETPKLNGHALRESGTTRTTHTSFSALSPRVGPMNRIKEPSRYRSSRSYSSMSHGSSLIHHVVRLYYGIRALYHLPWCATPPKRVAEDFIPGLCTRSKFWVHRDPNRVPSNVQDAARAARNMEPSDGKSWYYPVRQQQQQQVNKQRKRGKGAPNRHQHAHSHSLQNPYQQIFMGDPRVQPQHADGQTMYMYSPTMPQPYVPQGSPYGPQQFYMVPGPPPPPTNPGAGGNGGGNGGGGGNNIRIPQPTRPPSAISFSNPRPAPRPVQNGTIAQPQTQNPNPDGNMMPNNNNGARPDVQRPPPAAQPMYMIVSAPPGLPPSYGNVYPYPYTPPWTPPQRL